MNTEDFLDESLRDALMAVQRVAHVRPQVAIVLGSGLATLADAVADSVSIPYDEIPHFPSSTAPGHAGRLVMGELEGRPVAVMAGRVHLYEGYTPQQVAFPVRLLRRLGAETLIITNAAGGVNLEFEPGALMLISDHINYTGNNPLVGQNDPVMGTRFPDMTEAYSSDLKCLARRVAAVNGVPLREGVYMGFLGPSFETPAEIRMARTLGADAVGMSTVTEVIAASHAGFEVVAISCITNMAAGILPRKLTGAEVIETAQRASGNLVTIIRGVVEALPAPREAVDVRKEWDETSA